MHDFSDEPPTRDPDRRLRLLEHLADGAQAEVHVAEDPRPPAAT